MFVYVFVYIVYVCVIECIFLIWKKIIIYYVEVFGGFYVIWNILFNFKKMMYKDVKCYCIIFYNVLGFF